MSLTLTPYENLLRPSYELYSAVAWTAVSLLIAVIALFTNLPKAPFYYMGLIGIVGAAIRWYQTIKLWDFKISLAGKPFSLMPIKYLVALMNHAPSEVWLGGGFNWGAKHTQRALEIRKRDLDTVLPPHWFMKFRGVSEQVKKAVGKPWIHGLEPKEEHVYIPLSSMEGHTLVVGTTGAGKTRL